MTQRLEKSTSNNDWAIFAKKKNANLEEYKHYKIHKNCMSETQGILRVENFPPLDSITGGNRGSHEWLRLFKG